MFGYLVGGFFVATVVPAVISVGYRFFRPKRRGVKGEKQVDKCLRKFKGNGFARFRDVMIQSRDRTSQIDNILVSQHGIFVIEMKNYVGTIKGRTRDANWVQFLPGTNYKPREFYNPILQNEGHIIALRRTLYRSYPKLQYHNIVVFSDECRLPNIPGVVNLRGLHKALKNEMLGPPRLSKEEVSDIQKLIESIDIKETGKRSTHVEYARNAAAKAKERERKEVLRNRAKAHAPAAIRVQSAFSEMRTELENGRVPVGCEPDRKASLNDQIKQASDSVDKRETTVKEPAAKKELEVEL